MMKRLISWLYTKYVFLPAMEEKLRQMYPGAKIEVRSSDRNGIVIEEENPQYRQTARERERIPDDRLH